MCDGGPFDELHGAAGRKVWGGEEVVGGGEADDPTADDDDVCGHCLGASQSQARGLDEEVDGSQRSGDSTAFRAGTIHLGDWSLGSQVHVLPFAIFWTAFINL